MISKHLIVLLVSVLGIFGNKVVVEQIPANQRVTPLETSQASKTMQCNKRYQRQEIRTLNREQLDNFMKAINDMKANGMFDELCKIHLDNNDIAHATPYFLPWHREFIQLFEKELQKTNPFVSLPYWDWSIDSQAPELSKIMSHEYFGGPGQGCLSDGPLKGWECQYPEPHCLERSFDGGHKIGSFYSPELLKYELEDQPNYEEFRAAIEGAPHGLVHNNIGGDMSTMASCNDPLFYLHHAFVDKLWNDWQNSHSNLKSDFSGTLDSGYQAKSEDILEPFNIPVYKTLSISDNYCYSYGNSPQIPLPTNNRQKKDPNHHQRFFNPNPYDREDQDHLRTVPELPDSYIKRFKLNKTRVRMQEYRANQEVIRLNAIGYISRVSLGLNGLLLDVTDTVVGVVKNTTSNVIGNIKGTLGGIFGSTRAATGIIGL